jgi:galactokinase
MIKAVAPGRVNLIGDHTDYTGGLVLPMAIDMATTIEGVREGSSIELDSAEMDGHTSIALPSRHSADRLPTWSHYVAAVAELLNPSTGFSGNIRTTIPVGGGLSSSAALEIAVALALGAEMSPLELALLCQKAENLATGVPTGIMDQLCIASSIEGHATLIDCTRHSVTPIPVPTEVKFVVRFIAHRTLVGSEYADRVNECRRAEAEIGSLAHASIADAESIADSIVRVRARHVVTENARVREFGAAMSNGDWVAAGQAMIASHQSLASDFAVSNATMDEAVNRALEIPGVFGARMTGGGFGGCIVAMCEPSTEIDGWVVRPSAGARVVSS